MRACLFMAALLIGHEARAGDGVEAETTAKRSPMSWSLQLEGGSEYDTNIHRLEVRDETMSGIVGSPLLRGGARLRVDYRPSRGRRLHVSGFGGAKLFASEDGQSENVAIASGNGHYAQLLGGRKAVIGARGSFYEAFGYQPFGAGDLVTDGRNFAFRDGEAFLTLPGPRQHRLTVHAGYRSFRYKPDQDFDWSGDHYGLGYTATLWRGDPDEDLDAASIDVNVSYRVTRRGYRGVAFTNICGDHEEPEPRCFSPTTLGRTDMHHAAAAEVIYTGDRIYSARYGIQATDSNSYGQSLVRQRFEVGLTTETWARVFLTAKAAVQLNTFLDPLLLARDVVSQTFITIDDENRNALSMHLSRDLNEHWSVEGRYALFTNEFATEELGFRRQVMYLGAVYTYR